MRLKTLLKDLTDQDLPDDLIVQGLCFDSRHIQSGDLFFAWSGSQSDGASYLAEASKGGALAVVVAADVKVPNDVLAIRVENPRSVLALAASRFYKNPSKDFYLVVITATNGKTTLTYLIEQVMRSQNLKTGLMGTIEIKVGDQSLVATHTTPDAVSIQKTFKEMKTQSVDAVTMEVSSHALDQCRVDGSHFDTAVFTNLTQDHLDYHKSFEDYFLAKARLFDSLLKDSIKSAKTAVVNLDDPFGQKLIERIKDLKINVMSFSVSNPKATLYAKDFTSSLDGFQATFVYDGKEIPIQSNLIGEHNLKNIMASFLVGVTRFKNTDFCDVFKNISVPGRLERIGKGPIFVDYAHTPDALENVLQAIRRIIVKSQTQGKLITVFGCGGDRDRTKRPLMGEAAAKLSDIAIVTSDNPRTEDPDSIIQDVIPGVQKNMTAFQGGKGFLVEADRRKAIAIALEQRGENDVVVVAGKGHEDYQIIGTTKTDFDDREVIRSLLK